MTRADWRQRGDTLLEVTMALAIIASILTGATAIARAANRQGIDARERTQVAEFLQEQAEALRNYRDNTDWAAFTGATPCSGFMMGQVSNIWQPVASGAPTFTNGSSVPTLQISITCGPYPGNPAAPELLFTITATWTGISGTAYTSVVSTVLGELDDFQPCIVSAASGC